MKTNKNERGAVTIVEATFIFPIVFFILILLIYLGNGYYLKARIDSYVTQYSLIGASQCADPLLNSASGGSLPTSSKGVDVKPYRYIFTGYMGDIGAKVTTKINKELKNTGFFSNMTVTCSTTADADTKLFYSTFYVDVEFKIKIPMNIFGIKLDLLKFNSRSEVPITDVGEFIRNVDMAVDFVEGNKAIQDGMNTVSEFFNKLPGGKS
ncbi:MAG: pilus assembly protein [Clostridia bacterium]|nr:pilus assembly protein [Clostridia bacterium]